MNVLLDLEQKHHTLYDELVNYPPEGVTYHFPLPFSNKYNFIRSVYGSLPKSVLSHVRPVMRNVFSKNYSKKDDAKTKYDLTHFCNRLPRIDFGHNEIPYVIDAENMTSFIAFDHKAPDPYDSFIKTFRLQKKEVEGILHSNRCKKLILWTNTGAKTMYNYLDKSKLNVEVVYPTIHLFPEVRRSKDKDKICLLFMGSINNPDSFYQKGGIYALKVFEVLSKKYNIELLIRSDIPQEIKNKYNKYSNIKIIAKFISKEEILNIYSSADIFLAPCAFGSNVMSTLESMSAGLPLIGINSGTANEFNDHYVTGFLAKPSKDIPIPDGELYGLIKEQNNYAKKIDLNVLDELVNYTSMLIEDEDLRLKMGRNARKNIDDGGKFSIKTRNEKLKKIYEEAIT